MSTFLGRAIAIIKELKANNRSTNKNGFSLANNPSNPIPIVTYTYVKNIWNNPFNNINVDSTTQGQAEQTKMTSVNVKNMSNSIAGFV